MKIAKKILLIEDDEFTCFMMRKIVKALNVDVDFVHDGLDGCDLLSENPQAYGVVLMDIHLPGAGGVSATHRIRNADEDPPRNIPIIAVTSDRRYHDARSVSEIGMNGFIPKPVTAGDLLGLVERYCISAEPR